MPEAATLVSSHAARARFFCALVAAVLAAFAGPAPVQAQTPAASKRGGGAAVRARRAGGTGAASKKAPAAKTAGADKAAGADAEAKDAKAPAAEAQAPTVEDSKGAEVDTPTEDEMAAGGDAAARAGGEGGLEDLRERIEFEKNGAARARMQRELVEGLTAAGRKAEAVDTLRAMLAEERFDPPFFYNVGNHLARLDESGAAVDAYRKAASQRRGHYARAQHNLGVVLTRLGRWEEAEEALTAALKQENFTYAEASYNLGRLHALRGEAGLAIDEWKRTLRLQPGHADAAAALARALAEDGDPEAALAVLDSFNARAGRRGEAAPRVVTVARGEIVAAANVAGGEREEAKRTAAPEREAGPKRGALRPLVVRNDTYEFLRRARAAREAARLAQAASLYRDAIRSNGGYFAPANLELGFALSGLGRTDEAIESLLLVVRRSGARYPIAFYHLGRLHESAGQLAQAGDAFARAAELMGETGPQFYADLSRVREKEGKSAEALAAMESYVSATERLGDVPAWARDRVAKLRQTSGAAPAQAAPPRN